MSTYHVPVMLTECIDGLDIKSGGTYVDATTGGGGHSAAILEKLAGTGRLICPDPDSDPLATAKQRLSSNQNVSFFQVILVEISAQEF